MKKKITIVFLIFISGLITYLGYISISKYNKTEEKLSEIQTLPLFTFYNIKTNEIFTEDSLKQSKCLLIMYFHPDCDFCHAQLDEMSKEINKFSNFQILLISSADKKPIDSLLDIYRLTKNKNINILQDKDFIFNDIFGESPIPTSLIYDKYNKLLKKYKGKVKVDSIIKLCN